MTDTTNTHTSTVVYEPMAVLATANRALVSAVAAIEPRVEVVDLRSADLGDSELQLARRSGVLLLVPPVEDVLGAVGEARSLLLTDDLDDATVWAQAVTWRSGQVVILPDGEDWLSDTIRTHFGH